LPDNQIACGCYDGSISIWNLDNSTKVKTFKAHDGLITHLALSDKTKLISFSREDDIKINIWSLETFENIQHNEDSFDNIFNFELTSNGNLLSCSRDKTVKLWELESGEFLKSIRFDQIAYCVKILNDELIAVGLRNGEIKIYNFNKEETIKTVLAHESYIDNLYLLSNGNLLSQSYGEIKYWKILDNTYDNDDFDDVYELKLGVDFFQTSLLKNEIKESFSKLNKLIEDYEKIDPVGYIFDYIQENINIVNLNYNEIKEEIYEKSDQIIKKLKGKLEKCKSNVSELEKINLDTIKSEDLQSCKLLMRIPYLKQEKLDELLDKMYEKINDVKNEIKRFKKDLLMNEAIYFDKYEKNISFGKLHFHSSKCKFLSQDCGQLINSFNQHKTCITSIQVNKKFKKLFSAFDDETI
jgi:WD40 repeat protein